MQYSTFYLSNIILCNFYYDDSSRFTHICQKYSGAGTVFVQGGWRGNISSASGWLRSETSSVIASNQVRKKNVKVNCMLPTFGTAFNLACAFHYLRFVVHVSIIAELLIPRDAFDYYVASFLQS